MTQESTSYPTFAVVGADGVYLDSGRRLPLPEARDLRYWLEAMTKRQIDELYIHPAAPLRWLDADIDAAAPEWHVEGGAGELVGEPWWTATKPGVWGMRHIIQTAYEDRARWREAGDAATLRDALLAYRDALTIPYHRSPGATGTRLLRRLHSAANATRLDLPAPLPPALLRGSDDGPLLWRRALTDAEAKKRYVHSFDINGQYLAACSSLPVGVGAPIQRGPADAARLLADPRHLPPGYWRLSVTPSRLLPLAPDPLEGAQQTQRGWITTPTVRLLLDLGATLSVREAWVWPESRRYLEPWYQVMRQGRAELMMRQDAAAALALATLKTSYTTTVNGWMVSTKWDRSSDTLYRPDWSMAIRALARANEYRTIARVTQALGACPFFAVGQDCLYLVADEPDPRAAAPEGLRLSPALGHFKVKDAGVPLCEVQVLRDPAWTIAGLQRELNARRREGAVHAA